MFARFSVKRPHMVIVAIILVVITGVLSFRDIGIDFLPNIELPYIVVATVYPGGESPEAVEEKVTAPLEKTLAEAEHIKNITTESYPMISFIILEFQGGTDVNSALIEINEKIKNYKIVQESQKLLDIAAKAGESSELVDKYSGAMDLVDRVLDPVVMTVSPSMLPIMKISLYEEGKTISESSERLKAAAQKLETVDGVASADVTGLFENKYFLNVDNGKLRKSVLSRFIDRENAFDGLYDGLLSMLDYAAKEKLSFDAEKIKPVIEAIIDEVYRQMTEIADKAIREEALTYADEQVFDGLRSYVANVVEAIYTGDALFDALLDRFKEEIISVLNRVEIFIVETVSARIGEEAAAEIENQRDAALLELNAVLDAVSDAAANISASVAGAARTLLKILSNAETRSQYKIIFFDALDAVYDYAGAQIGEIIGADLIEAAFFANNIEMTVGSLNGALVTVGDKIKTEEELFSLPIASINAADEILNAVTGLR
jgi:hypothetical protein